MYQGIFSREEKIRRCLNGKDIDINDIENYVRGLKKFEYSSGGALTLTMRTASISTGFYSRWTNVKNLRFDDKLYSTNNDFDWHFFQSYLNYKINQAPNINILLCLDDVCQIPLDLSQFTEISIDDLNFGDYPMLKDFLIEQCLNSSPMMFYLRRPDCPISHIFRYAENKIFPKFKNGEMECDDSWGNLHLIEYFQRCYSTIKGHHIFYSEFIHNLDFNKEENLIMWDYVLWSLKGEDKLLWEHRYLPSCIIGRKDHLQMKLQIRDMKIPGAFLDMLRNRIIPLYEAYQEKERERLQEVERLENIRREEEERNRDFNLKNKHYNDANISTDNNHFYLGSYKLIGTTRIISNFFPKFDAEYWAGIKAPLMGKTPQQLLDEWDRKGKESAEAGTRLHQRIDDYYHHKEVQAEDKDYLLFKQFANAYKLNPYRSEWAIYDEDTNIVGVVDMLDYSNGDYILYDWKRSEKIVDGGQPIKENKFDEHGLRPIENVPNTDYWHYALQLSFYRYILEKNYGIRIKESRLVVLHPSLNLPVVLTTPYMIDEVNKIIAVMKM